MSDWYYGTQDAAQGPAAADEIRRLLATGEITPETVVWSPAEGVGPTPLASTRLTAEAAEKQGVRWHYERGGARVGPVDEVEIRRLVTAGQISRDTLVWSPEVGPAFVRLAETRLAPPVTEPPALPASAVGDTLAWVLVAIPTGLAVLEHMSGLSSTSLWGWPLATFVANLAVSALDERRIIRSGVADKAIRLGFWIWLVPVYLYQRARALKGPKHYVWAWAASFVASLFVGGGDLGSLVNGDTYFGIGVPACDSSYEARQVRKVFDGMSQVKAAGLAASGVTNARELGASGDIRTCVAQINASNAQTYAVIYTVENRDGQILTNIQLR